jgi:hypothetical protein
MTANMQNTAASPNRKMQTEKQIQERLVYWLVYWRNAKMVSVENIVAFVHVTEARKYCECMRVGVFQDVTDLSIWRALKDLRASEGQDEYGRPVKTEAA